MILLVIDPASNSGYAVFLIENGSHIANLIAYGDFEVTGECKGSRCIDMKNNVIKLIENYNPNHIIVEDFFFKSSKANGSIMNAALRAACWMACAEKHINYTTISPFAWKKTVSCSSKATKTEKATWKSLAEKIRIQHALWNKYGIRFSNHSLSHKTNKPVKLRYDAIDAVGIGIHYAIVEAKCTTFVNKVVISPDYTNINSMYIYDDNINKNT